MKVMLVNALYPPNVRGGAERSVQGLAEGLAASGVEVVVVATAPASGSEQSRGVRVHSLSAQNQYWAYDGIRRHKLVRQLWHAMDAYNPLARRTFAEIIRREQPDVIHTNNLQGLSVSVWNAARVAGIPVVHTLRDYYLTCARSVRWRHGTDCRRTCIQCLPFFAARKLASRSVRGVVGVSRSIVEAHQVLGFFPNAKAAHVIHNAGPEVDASPVPRDLKREVTFGFLGRLETAKGVDLLVETFAHRCDGRLLIAGGGVADYVVELQRRASAASIELVGHVDTAQFFDRIDVLLVPSLWQEPLSRAALEAQAYGVPVIASRRGGLVELIDDGVTGLLFDPDQPGSLPAAIDRLVASPDLYRRLSEAGLAEARKRTRERLVREYQEVYEEIAADRP